MTAALLCLLLSSRSSVNGAQSRGPRLLGTAKRQTLILSLSTAVNGGLVGSVGPCLHAMQASTGLDPEMLGRSVLFNRLLKLLGTLVCTVYMRSLQREQLFRFPPHWVLATCMGIASVACTGIYGMRSNAAVLQFALMICGLIYGFTDTAVTQLTLWSVTDPREQRTHVAILNAGFTLGAVIAPAVVAASLTAGGSAYICFIVLASLAALAAVSAMSVESPSIYRTRCCPAPAQNAKNVTTRNVSPSNHGQAPSQPAESKHARLIVAAMMVVLACVTGCEHSAANYLPTYGQQVGGIAPCVMAMMASTYWAMISVGRFAWAALSATVPSGWPVLFLDGTAMLLGGICFVGFYVSPRHTALLWAGTAILGAGIPTHPYSSLLIPALLDCPTAVCTYHPANRVHRPRLRFIAAVRSDTPDGGRRAGDPQPAPWAQCCDGQW